MQPEAVTLGALALTCLIAPYSIALAGGGVLRSYVAASPTWKINGLAKLKVGHGTHGFEHVIAAPDMPSGHPTWPASPSP